MNDEQIQAAGEWMARVESLLEQIVQSIERLDTTAARIDAGVGDIHTKLIQLQQAVAPIEKISHD